MNFDLEEFNKELETSKLLRKKINCNFDSAQKSKIIKIFEKARENLIIVEGKKDLLALRELGFKNIFIINETGKSLGEKIEEIEEKAGKIKITILTDFDKKGKKLYLKLKSELSTRKVKLDNSFRGILLKLKISHIEGLSAYIKNAK